jgi:pantetheine-phosphate adenylyltransferase
MGNEKQDILKDNFGNEPCAPRIAIFPGTFDPFTIGHLSLVKRGLRLVDEIIIAIGINLNKKTVFSVEERIEMTSRLFRQNPNVSVQSYEGLTVDFAKKAGAEFILRGIRSVNDFEYEKNIADVNHQLSGIETFVLFTEPEYTHVSSSIVRELLLYGKDVSDFVPADLHINEYKLTERNA